MAYLDRDFRRRLIRPPTRYQRQQKEKQKAYQVKTRGEQIYNDMKPGDYAVVTIEEGGEDYFMVKDWEGLEKFAIDGGWKSADELAKDMGVNAVDLIHAPWTNIGNMVSYANIRDVKDINVEATREHKAGIEVLE